METTLVGEAAPASAPAVDLAAVAKGLAVRGPKGPVFGPLDFRLQTGTVSAILGPSGSGRTCLLLTLSGRMRPSSGSLTVLGQPLPRAARRVIRRTAVAGVPTVDDLDGALSVTDVVRERAALLSSWRHRVPTWGSPGLEALTASVFGEHRPSANQRIEKLSPLAYRQLQILLAMMGEPQLLLVDEVDGFGDGGDELELWSRLGKLAATGVTVVGSSRPGAQVGADAVLADLRRHEAAA